MALTPCIFHMIDSRQRPTLPSAEVDAAISFRITRRNMRRAQTKLHPQTMRSLGRHFSLTPLRPRNGNFLKKMETMQRCLFLAEECPYPTLMGEECTGKECYDLIVPCIGRRRPPICTRLTEKRLHFSVLRNNDGAFCDEGGNDHICPLWLHNGPEFNCSPREERDSSDASKDGWLNRVSIRIAK
jgi:hypothetical protein